MATMHERVIEAIRRDAELTDRLVVLKEAVMQAKQAEDVARNSPILNATFASERDAALAEAKAIEDVAIAAAQVLFDEVMGKSPCVEARELYTAATVAARSQFTERNQQVISEYDTKMAAVMLTHVREAAEANAAADLARQELTTYKATIDQYRQEIKNGLGISLASILGT